MADITLADFWGYVSNDYDNIDDDKGVSMVMLNSDFGKQLFEKSKEHLHYWKRTMDEAINGNPALSHAFEPADNYEAFWKDYNEKPFEFIVNEYLYPEEIPEWFYQRKRKIRKQKINYYIRKMMGENIYNIFRKFIR